LYQALGYFTSKHNVTMSELLPGNDGYTHTNVTSTISGREP